MCHALAWVEFWLPLQSSIVILLTYIHKPAVCLLQLIATVMTSLSVSSLSLVAIPVYVKQSISFFETGSCGRLDITIGPKQAMGKTVENLMVRIHMPKAVSSANLTATQGNYTYDLATKVTKCSKDDAREDWVPYKSCRKGKVPFNYQIDYCFK